MSYFIIYFFIPLLIFHILYGLVIFSLIVVFRKIGIFLKRRVFLSFLILGIIMGFLVVWLWIYDIIVLINPITVLLGHQVYQLSIQYLGNPNSPQAHYSIPWILRIPHIFVFISITFWGLVGLLIQLIYNRRKIGIEYSTNKLK